VPKEGVPVVIGDKPVLVKMDLAHLLMHWRPGSYDWTWAEEYRDLIYGERRRSTVPVRVLVQAEGFGFQDHIAPILLGNDGRVWDGHHRICLAMQQGHRALMVELTDPEAAA
jgi:hypothetical protein